MSGIGTYILWLALIYGAIIGFLALVAKDEQDA